MTNKILELKNMKVDFKDHAGTVQAVRGIDLVVEKGDVLGIVGESGSGKSVAMKAVMGILPESAEISGDQMLFKNKNLLNMNELERLKMRGKEMTMIFQDPLMALNPVVKIGKQMVKVIRRHENVNRTKAKEMAVEILGKVGIPNPQKRFNQYPHEFSGGMRQRVLIAMALVCNPELLIADEPTTALDVTIQAQILSMLKNVNKMSGTTIILITHDMGVVASVCNKVAVMYGGIIMETGTVNKIFYEPLHPYTKALLESIPSMNKDVSEKLNPIPGAPPSLKNPLPGCPFADRCTFRMEKCNTEIPPLLKVSDGHFVRCQKEVFSNE